MAPACTPGVEPETLLPGQPLIWNRGGGALSVCRVLGTPTGSNTFNLRTWAGAGGT